MSGLAALGLLQAHFDAVSALFWPFMALWGRFLVLRRRCEASACARRVCKPM